MGYINTWIKFFKFDLLVFKLDIVYFLFLQNYFNNFLLWRELMLIKLILQFGIFIGIELIVV